MWPLAVIGVLTSVIGAFYYLRIIKVMYFDDAAEPFDVRPAASLSFVAVTTGLFTSCSSCSRPIVRSRPGRGESPVRVNARPACDWRLQIATTRPRLDWRLEVVETLGSTSDHCIACAKAGEPEGLAVLALRQTAGRGSRGRPWSRTAGQSLPVLAAASRTAMPCEAGRWSLLAAVALADALTPYLPDPGRLRLKWPNDVLLRGAKLSGILIDSADCRPDGRSDWLVIGCGVNLCARARGAGPPPTACLAGRGWSPRRRAGAACRRLLAQLWIIGAARAHAGRVQCRARRHGWRAARRLGTPMHVGRGQRHHAWKGAFAGLADERQPAADSRRAARVVTGIRTRLRRPAAVPRTTLPPGRCPMLLVVDAGNTNIVFAVHDAPGWRGIWRIATDPQRTSDEYAVWLLTCWAIQA